MTRAVRVVLLALGVARGAQDGIYGFGSATVGMSDTAILQRLKTLYATKLRPLEKKSHYNALQEPALSDAWFDAKPVVMLLGQYSVGKTSFIRYLLGRDFPKQHIGPEPTTDGFLAVMYGDQDKTTPGNALTSQPDTPFHSLRRFGNALLDKLEAVFVPAPILRRITLVDTPGVQAGERQKGRGYDLLAVMKWWAQHADRIVLVFDPFKMSDISSEFRDVIDQLKDYQSKVRVVLNKADNVESQKLMRVYGALMWALGSIVCSPEVPRVYIGSFIDEPWIFDGLSALMDAEENDLVRELDGLPEDNVMRKINEIARRASNVKVHCHLLAYIRECVVSKWMGKKQAQDWVCSPEGMTHCYDTVERQHGLSRGDFPSGQKLAAKLRDYDFNGLYKPSQRSKKMAALQELIDDDIPKLIKQLTNLQKRQKGGSTRPSFRPIRKRRPYPPDPDANPSMLGQSQAAASRLAGLAPGWTRPLQRAHGPFDKVAELREAAVVEGARAPSPPAATPSLPPLPPPLAPLALPHEVASSLDAHAMSESSADAAPAGATDPSPPPHIAAAPSAAQEHNGVYFATKMSSAAEQPVATGAAGLEGTVLPEGEAGQTEAQAYTELEAVHSMPKSKSTFPEPTPQAAFEPPQEAAVAPSPYGASPHLSLHCSPAPASPSPLQWQPQSGGGGVHMHGSYGDGGYGEQQLQQPQAQQHQAQQHQAQQHQAQQHQAQQQQAQAQQQQQQQLLKQQQQQQEEVGAGAQNCGAPAGAAGYGAPPASMGAMGAFGPPPAGMGMGGVPVGVAGTEGTQGGRDRGVQGAGGGGTQQGDRGAPGRMPGLGSDMAAAGGRDDGS